MRSRLVGPRASNTMLRIIGILFQIPIVDKYLRVQQMERSLFLKVELALHLMGLRF